ncbi:hypothetical protein [Bifidobacterium sp.]|uniref:hypothetical protein n=1 Tax=Bifidobacterium sp. TaxID=41200 RepID=UPI0025B96767|nr:hypothetical protein [Bifidobacterium sp.]MCI1225294.1 hypothetical protein [Bifidobacterium sp.]
MKSDDDRHVSMPSKPQPEPCPKTQDRPCGQRHQRHAATAIVALALGIAAFLLASTGFGGFAYLRRGRYNPADAIVLLGVSLSIPLSIVCSVGALVLAAITRLRRPSNREQLEAMERDRSMTGTAMFLSLPPLLVCITLIIGPP